MRLHLVDVGRRVDRLARSVVEIELAIGRAERRIEADARERIHLLRGDARARLAVLRSHQHEASRLLRALSTAPAGSWDDLARAAISKLTEARTVIEAMLERLRSYSVHDVHSRRGRRRARYHTARARGDNPS